MLFWALAAVITYSLLTYGAVLPNSFLLISILLAMIAIFYLAFAIIKGDSRQSILPIVIGIVFSIAFLQPRFAISLMVGLLAWAAARTSHRSTLRFFKVLVVIAISESILGLVQYFISPGWIFGYVNSAYRVSGALINRNHFAGLLEMLIPVAFGLAYIAIEHSGGVARAYVYLLAGAFVALALVLSLSRMGIFSVLFTMLFFAFLLQLRRPHMKVTLGLTLSIVALLFLGAIWVGVDAVVQRYSDLVGDEALFREGRLVVFRDAVNLIVAHPLGIGSGNFQDRFREYQTFRPDLLIDHAHNDYLETAAEWGMPIAIAFWVFIGSVWIRSARLFLSIESPEQRGILLACIGAMLSILVHSLADFNLQIPSNAMLFFTFVGISLSVSGHEKSEHGHLAVKD